MANTGGSDMITVRRFLVLLVACLLLTSNFVDARSDNDDEDHKGKGKEKGKDKEKGKEKEEKGKVEKSKVKGKDREKSKDGSRGDKGNSVSGGISPVSGGALPGGGGPENIYDVTKFGAKPDGRSSNELAFTKAWRAACDSSGSSAKVLIPPGQYVAGETVFQGPCAGRKRITVDIKGTLLAQEDPSSYSGKAWISIERVQNVLVTGGGTINGRGKSMWEYAGGDSPLPTSLQFQTVESGKMINLNFVDSMGVHVKASDCFDIEMSSLKITAPDQSPNTDGIHTSNATKIKIVDSIIGTGDDCVSLGHGSNDVLVSRVTCGPGHGISIGSLGKRPDELDMKGVTVSNCKLIGTDNGLRIKTFHDSKQMQASNIIFQDITMDKVKNPIIIDQHYNSKSKPGQSKVKLSDIHFRNIRGTSVSPVAVQLLCSSAVPCTGVELADISLVPAGGTAALTSSCSNAKTTVTGKLSTGPLKCS